MGPVQSIIHEREKAAAKKAALDAIAKTEKPITKELMPLQETTEPSRQRSARPGRRQATKRRRSAGNPQSAWASRLGKPLDGIDPARIPANRAAGDRQTLTPEPRRWTFGRSKWQRLDVRDGKRA